MNFPPSLAFISRDFLFLAMRSVIPMFWSPLNYSTHLFLTLGIVLMSSSDGNGEAFLHRDEESARVAADASAWGHLSPSRWFFSSSMAKFSTMLKSLLCKMLWPRVPKNDPGPSLSVIPLPHGHRKLILYLGTYPRVGYRWEWAGFMTILYGKSSSRTSLPCAMEKSTLSPVSHKYDVPAPKTDWAVKYLWGSRAGGLSWEGKAAHMQENYIFACCLSDICLPENKYTSRLERNWSYLCTLHP